MWRNKPRMHERWNFLTAGEADFSDSVRLVFDLVIVVIVIQTHMIYQKLRYIFYIIKEIFSQFSFENANEKNDNGRQ